MSQPICVLCAFYHPRADTHLPDMTSMGKQTCDTGLRRLEHELVSVRAAFLRLQEATGFEPGANDRVSQQLPSAPVASPSRQPNVSGSKERRLPIDLARADLLAPATDGYVSDVYRDQAGHHSVAGVLNEWVAAWHDRWYYSEHYPRRDAVSLIDWISGIRLMVVADQDTAIADFAAELHELRNALRNALGDREKKRQPMWGVKCPRCKLVSQLMMDPEDPDHHRECANCGRLLTQPEYLAHLRDLVDEFRATRF
jgi:phage FluMu protein Com